MKHLERIMLGLVLLASTLVIGTSLAIGQTESTPAQPQSKTPAKRAHGTDSDRGQQVFDQNCARCHNAPQGFSSHISGAIAMHMRVRAGLSDEDYKALRRFLNP